MSQPQFLVPPAEIDATEVVLDGPELHHLRVRRLRVGDDVLVCDGRGRQRQAVIRQIGATRALLELGGEVAPVDEPAGHLTLAIAAIQASKLELVVEKTTELGVNSIVVFESSRTQLALTSARVARLDRIAASAAKQSKRASVPTIGGPVSFEAALRYSPCEHRYLLWEDADRSAHPPDEIIGPTVVMIGPEGGFSAREVEDAVAADFKPISLGAHVLRAETAAIVAVAFVQRALGARAHDR